MARYIDAEELYKILNEGDMLETYEDYMAVNRAINDTPTADVVPKSEVDEIVRQWKEEANCWQNNYIAEISDNEQIKKKVARKIFEEIENHIGIGHDILDVWNILAELKKKYAEDL